MEPLSRNRAAQAWWIVLVLAVASALIADLVLAITEPDPRGDIGTSVIRFFSYFTIQSNIFVLLATLPLIANPAHDGKLWRAFRLAALVGITITGIVYWGVLAPTSHPQGLHVPINIGLHAVSPLMTVGGWLWFGPRRRITTSVVAAMLIWPVTYIVYTLAHGAATSWYPYGFLNVIANGYAVVVRNIIGVLVMALVLIALFLLGDRRLPDDTASIPAHARE
jgi:hypothetical protein